MWKILKLRTHVCSLSGCLSLQELLRVKPTDCPFSKSVMRVKQKFFGLALFLSVVAPKNQIERIVGVEIRL